MGNAEAKAGCRVSSVAFDEDQEVSAVTIIVSTGTLEVIRGYLPGTTWIVRSETENEVTLPVQDMLTVFRHSGRMTGVDPRYPHTHEIYDSLCMVVHGLMDND